MTPYSLLIDTLDPVVVDHHYIPPRPERRVPPPPAYVPETLIGKWLRQMTGGVDPWSHQVRTINLLDEGKNVVITTGTASGKTLPMQTRAVRNLLEDKAATVLVFCPQKGLVGDQAHRWRQAVAAAGFTSDVVGELTGDVSMDDRKAIISRARVLIATPDIIHAYVMRNLALPDVTRFIANLTLTVVDEAHQLEGAFGSSCAYLFRRVRTAVMSTTGRDTQIPLQFLAASATIADPAGHLEALTGLSFEVVGEDQNGAPFHGLHLLHVEGPGHGSAGEALLAHYVGQLAEVIAPDAAIGFFDDRQGVERACAKIDREDVEPYRAGLESSDRAAIESSLRNGKLRAVVSTSALEVGVDVPQFTVGVHMGVPWSSKALRQRAGRAGRAREAVFAVVAPKPAFAVLGTSLQEFYERAPEASPLYLGNRVIQYQQACCLLQEMGFEDGELFLPPGIDWPDTFAEALAMAVPGAPKAREIEHIAAQSTGRPHLDFPMRKFCETTFALRMRATGDELGTIDGEKALREAYPGAVFYQRKKAYRVSEWKETSYERSIYLEPVPPSSRSTPIVLTRTSISHQPSELQDGNLLVGKTGSIAEMRLQVHQSVVGYTYGGKEQLYRDLSKRDPRKSSKQRNYSTTGVAIRIQEPWFAGHGGAASECRKQVAEALVTMLARDRGIASSELGFAHSSIAMFGPGGPQGVHDAIVIFDQILDGASLTKPLFSEFSYFLERLRKGAELAGEEALVSEMTVARLERWYRGLEPKGKSIDLIPVVSSGERLIYAAGSVVGVRINGTLHERRLTGHRLIPIGDHEHLVYTYQCSPGVTGILPHDQVEPVGHDWRHVVWNSGNDSIQEIAA